MTSADAARVMKAAAAFALEVSRGILSSRFVVVSCHLIQREVPPNEKLYVWCGGEGGCI